MTLGELTVSVLFLCYIIILVLHRRTLIILSHRKNRLNFLKYSIGSSSFESLLDDYKKQTFIKMLFSFHKWYYSSFYKNIPINKHDKSK